MKDVGKSQVSVIMDDELRKRLEGAAREEVRSLSGEILYRLKQSLESNFPTSKKRSQITAA